MKKESANEPKTGLRSIYLNQFVRSIAFSLIGIFVPIYFLTLGFSLSHVFLFFLIFHLATFVSVIVTLLISKRIGYKPVFIGSLFAVIIFFFLLYNLNISNTQIVLLAIIFGVGEAFYFIPLHAFFTRLSEETKRGRQVSNYASLGQLAGLISPLIGALIVLHIGFSFLFFLAIIIFAFSAIPLFYLKNAKPKTSISLFRIKELVKKHKKFFIGIMAQNIQNIILGTVWPIFVYVSLKDIISVGWVGTLTTAGSILFTLFVGRFYDKKSKYLLLKVGGFLYVALWITRIYFESTLFIYASTLVAGFLAIMIDIPFNSLFYDRADKEENSDEFIIVMEIPVVIARSFLWLCLILIGNKFVLAFILAAIASLFFILFRFNLQEETQIKKGKK